MRWIRDPWVGGQKQLHFWNPDPDLPIQYATSIKGRLLSSRLMLKPFSGEKILISVKMRPKNGGFGKMGVQTLDTGFATS